MRKIGLIYCAGSLTPRGAFDPNPAIEYLGNIRKQIKAAKELLLHGFSPFCPALDFLLFLMLNDNEKISEEQIKKFSLDWLAVSDAVLLIEGWQTSLGTAKEIEFAMAKGIPVFKSLQELEDFQKEGK